MSRASRKARQEALEFSLEQAILDAARWRELAARRRATIRALRARVRELKAAEEPDEGSLLDQLEGLRQKLLALSDHVGAGKAVRREQVVELVAALPSAAPACAPLASAAEMPWVKGPAAARPIERIMAHPLPTTETGTCGADTCGGAP